MKMGMMDTAGNLITLGVAYKMTSNLMKPTKKRKRKTCKKRR
jgi:hypothetical protein